MTHKSQWNNPYDEVMKSLILTLIVSAGWEIAFLLVHISYPLTLCLWFILRLEPTPIVQNIKLVQVPLTCCPSAVPLIFTWLFLPGVCFTMCVRVCMFIIFTTYNTGKKIMQALTQVYISVLETGQIPAEDSADNRGWQGYGTCPKEQANDKDMLPTLPGASMGGR